jgi:hypothetical protein
MRTTSMKNCLFIFAVALILAACKPEIAGTSPDDGSMDVKGHSQISADFSTSIDPSTLQFSVETNGIPVPGAVTIDKNPISNDDVAVFAPDKNSMFTAGKTYTATIKSGVASADGGSKMKSDYSWSFSIETIPPVLESISPDNGQNVYEGSPEIALRFNESIGEISFNISTEHGSPVFSDDRRKVSIRLDHVNAGQSCRFILYGFSDTAGNYTELNRLSEFRVVRPQ